MNESAPRTPHRRMYWIAAFAAGAGLIAAWRSLHETWVTFAINESIVTRAGGAPVNVTAQQTLDASGIVSVTGVEWLGFPRPLVILALALGLCLMGIALRLWILPAGAALFLVPAAWSQQAAIEAVLLRGPGGQYVTAGPALAAVSLAMALVLATSVVSMIQIMAVRRWEIAEARAEALARGEAPVPTTRELFGSLVANKIRVGTPAHVSGPDRSTRT